MRGTTSRKIVRMVRNAGAREVHLRISCPPTISPCYYGVDTPTKKELIASNHTIEEIRRYVEADSLGYLSLEALRRNGRRQQIAVLLRLLHWRLSHAADSDRELAAAQKNRYPDSNFHRTATVAASALAVPHSRIRELAEIAMKMDGVPEALFRRIESATPEFIKRAAQKAMADGFTYYTENAGLAVVTRKRWPGITRRRTASRSTRSRSLW